MIIGFGNNVVSSLAADITATQTTIQVMPGAGALFAGLLTYDYSNDSNPLKVYAKITLTDAKETVFEVCHLTAVNNDMLTVVRGQEGTAAKGWSLNDVIANFATRGSENQFVQIEQLQSGHYTSAVAGGTANGLTLALPATFFLNGSTEWALKTPILIYPTLNNTGASTLQLTMGGRVMGTYPLVKGSNTALRAGDIVAKNPFQAVFNADEGRFIVLNPTTNVGAVMTVNSHAPDATGNVKLGTAADADVGTNLGDVMSVGAFGLGTGPIHRADAYGNIAEFFRVNISSANRPGNNAYGGVRLPIDGEPTSGYALVGADLSLWVGQSTTQGKGVTWARAYTTAFKPTAADVGAFPLNGGNVGKDGVVSAGDIKSDKNNIIVKQATQAGGDKGYFIQNGDGVNIAFITAYSDGSVRINSLVQGNRNLSFNGRINSDQELSEAGQRVYSPNNPQPISFPVTSVNGRTGAVSTATANFGAGWYKDEATGFIVQWGFKQSISSNTETSNFNIVFPNGSLAVVANLGVTISNGQTVYTNAVNNQGFSYKTSGERLGFTWVAIGY
ncbi:gp53-like domain-containing protein [Serratia ureilytica]|uniref:gp53-like domain-containing protein n=1 Tax=Serratia ureilytica TaxID=300181 RepID=UPI0021C42F5F|nr:hypothetical protein [Serratia ureilytica]